jgi:hypothetical protein
MTMRMKERRADRRRKKVPVVVDKGEQANEQ